MNGDKSNAMLYGGISSIIVGKGGVERFGNDWITRNNQGNQSDEKKPRLYDTSALSAGELSVTPASSFTR